MTDDLTTDILIKAAEDVSQGLWCEGEWFGGIRPADYFPAAIDQIPSVTGESYFTWLREGKVQLDDLASARKCAEGSIAFATMILGGQAVDYQRAKEVVGKLLMEREDGHIVMDDGLPACAVDVAGEIRSNVYIHNDECMQAMNPHDAGTHLAEIFREAANV